MARIRKLSDNKFLDRLVDVFKRIVLRFSDKFHLDRHPVYHGIAGEFVKLIEPHTEADPAALLVQFKIGFGSLIGRGPHVFTEDDRHYTNLFGAFVGVTSKARKGTS